INMPSLPKIKIGGTAAKLSEKAKDIKIGGDVGAEWERGKKNVGVQWEKAKKEIKKVTPYYYAQRCIGGTLFKESNLLSPPLLSIPIDSNTTWTDEASLGLTDEASLGLTDEAS